MTASHASLRDDFNVSLPAIDQLVEWALADRWQSWPRRGYAGLIVSGLWWRTVARARSDGSESGWRTGHPAIRSMCVAAQKSRSARDPRATDSHTPRSIPASRSTCAAVKRIPGISIYSARMRSKACWYGSRVSVSPGVSTHQMEGWPYWVRKLSASSCRASPLCFTIS